MSSKFLLDKFYRSLYKIRRVEEEIARIYPTDKIKSPVHLSIGQEAVAVGVCEALRPVDVIFGTYRSHAIYLAKGGDFRKMLAELYGKSDGCAKGKGGSMHLIDTDAGVMGTSAIVATTIPHAVGYAYSVKILKQDRLVVSFFGDAAVEEGAFHESVNFAILKNVPIIFICENNLYAVHSPLLSRQLKNNIWERARAYGLRAERIEGNNLLKIYERVGAAAAEIRSGASGPWFFECMTYRWKEHVGPGEDFEFGYRSRSEAEPWMKNDQLEILGSRIDLKLRKKIEENVESEIRDAFDFAERSPFPDEKELYTDLFKETLSRVGS